MSTLINKTSWGIRSLSWWLTLMLAIGIIYIGLRFMLAPEAGAEGFGIPFSNPNDVVYGRIKGIRDIVSGLVALPLLWLRMRRATAWVLTTLILVPATDFFIVLSANGIEDTTHLLIHSGTVLAMAFTSILLFRGH